MSERKETTAFLGKLLERDKLSGAGKYWGKEVVLDYMTSDIRRIDYMQFEPVNQISIDGIEKGVFKGYEVKSCKADFNSGFGKNWICEYNYLVTTMHTYKELLHKELNELPHYVGIYVAIPKNNGLTPKEAKIQEFESPTPLPPDYDIKKWHLVNIKAAMPTYRKKSMIEMMFCLLRNKTQQ